MLSSTSLGGDPHNYIYITAHKNVFSHGVYIKLSHSYDTFLLRYFMIVFLLVMPIISVCVVTCLCSLPIVPCLILGLSNCWVRMLYSFCTYIVTSTTLSSDLSGTVLDLQETVKNSGCCLLVIAHLLGKLHAIYV